MKIQFPNQEPVDTAYSAGNLNYGNNRIASAGVSGVAAPGVRLQIGGPGQSGFFEEKKRGMTLTDIQNQAANTDVAVMQDLKTVASHTLSAEDYRKAEEEGFDLASMNPEDTVTIQDRVKAEVAKAGVRVEGYTDDIPEATLAKVLGNPTLAKEITQSFQEADLPLTAENAADIEKAWNLAVQLQQPADSQLAYMVENQLTPAIWDFYVAENSGASAHGPAAGYYAQDVKGYYVAGSETPDPEDPANAKLLQQLEDVAVQAGFTDEKGAVTEEGLRQVKWLFAQQLPVTEENLQRLENLQQVSFPVTEEVFAHSVAAAVSRGARAVNADLTVKQDLYSMAVSLEARFTSEEFALELQNTYGDLTARRMLEEVRLSMTAEVNVRLLESDFAIDTAPMEELIDALKQAESAVAGRYFPEAEDSVAAYRLMSETNDAVKEIPAQPAASLAIFTSRNSQQVTLGQFHREGLVLRDTYEKANESYEALWTAPRADYGDSIRKAFANVNEIVKDLGLEVTEENTKAVRVLGYNHMSMTVSNVEAIVNAQRQVREVVERMTPANVLNMIRDGVNPLETSFAELSGYFDAQQTGGYEKVASDYSHFLYELDRTGDITPQERESYIGVFRLLHQIEKNDGAVIGTVVNEQAQLQFRNLLSAARSGKFKGMDIRVDESVGTTEELVRAAKSISQQIESAYVQHAAQAELADFRKASYRSAQATELLDRTGIPGSAENLEAAEKLLSSEENIFADLDKRNRRADRKKERELTEALGTESFEADYESYYEQLEEAAGQMTLSAEGYLDVKSLQLMSRQIRLVRHITESQDRSAHQEYFLPAQIGKEMSMVHLTLESAAGGESSVEITLAEEALTAHFDLTGGRLEGYLLGNHPEEVQKWNRVTDIFVEALRENSVLKDLEVPKIAVLSRNSMTKTKPAGTDALAETADGTAHRTLFEVAKVFLASVQKDGE